MTSPVVPCSLEPDLAGSTDLASATELARPDRLPGLVRPGCLPGLIRLLRPAQWVKNLFVLAPLLFAGQFLKLAALRQSAAAFALFCVASSAAYVVNDIRDVDRDRRHPAKAASRPIAAGAVSVGQAMVLLAGLYALLAGGAWLVQPRAMLVIAGYLLLNLGYSFGLKDQPVIDIFTIAIGFVLRVYAGAVVLAVPLSGWMFVTTLSLALYLAAIKRRQELGRSGAQSRAVLKNYSVQLVDHYATMAATCTLIFYGLFVMTSRPAMIATIPFVIFGLFRYWYIVETLEGGESPSESLLADGQLVAVVLLWAAGCVYGLWPRP